MAGGVSSQSLALLSTRDHVMETEPLEGWGEEERGPVQTLVASDDETARYLKSDARVMKL